jgi:hypothetical protein
MLATDGGAANNMGMLGWIIATTDGIYLAAGSGPVFVFAPCSHSLHFGSTVFLCMGLSWLDSTIKIFPQICTGKVQCCTTFQMGCYHLRL